MLKLEVPLTTTLLFSDLVEASGIKINFSGWSSQVELLLKASNMADGAKSTKPPKELCRVEW